jgi:hypothetical protein
MRPQEFVIQVPVICVKIGDPPEVPATLHLSSTPIATNYVVSFSSGGMFGKPGVQVMLKVVLDASCVVVRVRPDAKMHDNHLWRQLVLC